MEQNENSTVTDIFRLRWMGALVGLAFALAGILLVITHFYSLPTIFEMLGFLRKREVTQIFLIPQNVLIAIACTFLFFILISAWAGLRLASRKASMKTGFLYGAIVLFFSLWLGFNAIVFASQPTDFNNFYRQQSDVLMVATIVLFFGSLLASAVFGTLFGFSIEKLSKTPGFGLPKDLNS